MKIPALFIIVLLLSANTLSRSELKKLSRRIADYQQRNGKTPGAMAWQKLRDHAINSSQMDTIISEKADTVLFVNGYRWDSANYFGEIVVGKHHLSYYYSKVTKNYDIYPDRILSTTQVNLLTKWDTVEIRRRETSRANFVIGDGDMNVYLFTRSGTTWVQRNMALKNYYDPSEWRTQ